MKKGTILTPLVYKNCIFCGQEFSNRRRNGGVYGKTQFDEKNSCSGSCGARSRRLYNEHKIERDILYIYWKGKTILADKENKDLLLSRNWGVDSLGYAHTGEIAHKEKRTRMHCLLLGRKRGFVIDHINMNKLDNRLSNLRFLKNAENISRCPARTISGVKCVYFRKDRRKWTASIIVSGKKKYLGCFQRLSTAKKERRKAERQYLSFM